MAHVVCYVSFCAHNLNSAMCNAKTIEINLDRRNAGEKTDCSTFLPRDFSLALLTLDNINYAGLVQQAFGNDLQANPDIVCQVCQCVYYMDNRCTATQIEIGQHSSLTSLDTSCRTYGART